MDELLRQLIREELAKLLDERTPRIAEAVATQLGAIGKAETYLGTDKAARIADVSSDTIREWVKAGHLKRCGDGRLKVRASDLAAYLERRKLRIVTDDTAQDALDKAAARLCK